MSDDLMLFVCPYLIKGPRLQDGKSLWAIPVIFLKNFKSKEKLVDMRLYFGTKREAHSLCVYLGKVYRYAHSKGKIS